MQHGPLILLACQDAPTTLRQLASFRHIAAEIQAEDASLLLIHATSPGHALRDTLARWRAEVEALGLSASLVGHEPGLGLVPAFNLGLDLARGQHRDALLVRPDTTVFEGMLTALRQASELDNMIGFLCPRTHAQAEARTRLPAFNFVPGTQDNCLWIRGTVLRDFGLLDPAYQTLTFAENDLISRAAACGYRNARVNAAQASHPARPEPPARPTQEDRQRLQARHPEFDGLIRRHEASADRLAQTLAARLPDDPANGYSVLFDFSDFLTHHNGTFEAGKKILACVCGSWPEAISVHVRISPAAFAFHELDRLPRLRQVAVDDNTQTFAAVLRFGQIFDGQALRRVFTSGAIVLNFMLDAIAHDSSGLTLAFDPRLWSYVCEWSDALLTNSAYTARQIGRRFPIGPDCELATLLHSTDPRDYLQADPAPAEKRHILVIGNKFHHKFVDETIEVLSKAGLPDDFVCIGARRKQGPDRFTLVESGVLDDAQMQALYAQARLIVYPSHYEGFGFPLMNAAALGIPVIARDLPVYHEVLDTMQPRPVVLFFSAIDEIPGLIGQAPEAHRQTPVRFQTWDDSATRIQAIIEDRLRSFSYVRLNRRLTWLPAPSEDLVQHGKRRAPGGKPAFLQQLIDLLRQANDRRLRKRRQARSGKALEALKHRRDTESKRP